MRAFIDISKKKLIVILIALFGLLIAYTVVSKLNANMTNKSPIVELRAENDVVYDVNATIKKKDFDVTAIHENGRKSNLSTKDFELSSDKLSAVGANTEVTLTLTRNPNITCDTFVKIKRDEVTRFACGYPNEKDVYAVLYSNGELSFEGKGDVMIFEEGDQPWLEEQDDCSIFAVSFQEGVTPTNMNYWFEGLETLKYVEPIPSSVKTMIRTFSECSSLKKAADWTKCTNLLNISECYASCELLSKTFAIPHSVKSATSAFENCPNLKTSADVSGATGLSVAVSMYKDCCKLNEASVPPNAQYIDEMFAGCYNLKEMPKIPVSVISMESTFEGDVSLLSTTTIPKSVQVLDKCFSGCEALDGSIRIDCNALTFHDVFEGAVLATKLNLTGRSKLLDAYANTNESGNVMVLGKKPNPEIESYNDVFKK